MALGFLARVPFRDPPFNNCLAHWDHLTLPNTGNSISDLQNSTLGTTICNWAQVPLGTLGTQATTSKKPGLQAIGSWA